VSNHHSVLWIAVLLSAVAASIVGTIIDNVVKGAADRKHNAVLLFNECLAEQHIAYLIFFVALATGAGFSKYWASALLQIAIVIVLGVYIKGIHSTTKHEAKLTADHECVLGPCPRLRLITVFRICALNCICTVVMFSIACYLAIITIHDPSGQ
jgi:hypothetical protein